MIVRLCFVIGVALLLLNFSGVTVSLRHPDIYTDKDVKFPQDITLTPEQFYAAASKEFEYRAAYITYLNEIVSRAIAHYWYDQGIEKYNLRIPAHENFILYMAGFLAPELFHKYEFMDYRRALERGVGFCSQAAIILSEVLREKGIDSRIVGLTGHVLVTAPVDRYGDEWWIFDPDYGVTIPYSLDVIEKNPAIIESYYAEMGYGQTYIDGLKLAFGPEGNSIKDGQGIEGYGIKLYYFEKLTYVLKWLIPIALVLPAVITDLAWRRVKQLAALSES